MKKKKKKPKNFPIPGRRDMNLAELEEIIERARVAPLNEEDCSTLKTAMTTLSFLTQEILAKSASIKRLRNLLFGTKSEKTSIVLGASNPVTTSEEASVGEAQKDAKSEPNKRKGHGRNGAAAYFGAQIIKVPNPSLQSGCSCPFCFKGRIYPISEPSMLIRITGVAPLYAKRYDCEQSRCNLCGEVFTAPAPEGVGDEKYDETAKSMIGLLKYGTGLPFNRIEKLQAGMGIPVPASTQWDLVSDAAEEMTPAFEELIRQAAQGDVLHNDDTTGRILELTSKQRKLAAADEETNERTGIFTSGIVSTCDKHRIALFFTGAKHAGENLGDVLARRAVELPPPIQMCDALSRNTVGDFETILANCNAHARRKYVEVADDFPEECRFVLETFRDVYKNDAIARQQAMSADERLQFHKDNSGPLMDSLKKWMKEQFEEHKVEPNSELGDAINYMTKHWSKLTLFLREPKAPLDNNICERAMKKAILHRKNSLFYKTKKGARVGDIFMSLIYTAELNDTDAFNYLVALQRHHDEVSSNPAGWMPWNYLETLKSLTDR